MTTETIHGLKPAISFLSAQLAKDYDKPVLVGGKISSNRFAKYDYWFHFENSSYPVRFSAPGWKWKNPELTPERINWSQYPITLQPKLLYKSGQLVEKLQLDFTGLEQVPGLTLEEEPAYAWAVFIGKGYFIEDSKPWQEYRRRHTLEAAALLQAQVAERIRKYSAIPPYMTDE